MRTRRIRVCDKYIPKVWRLTSINRGHVARVNLNNIKTKATEKIWLVTRKVLRGVWVFERSEQERFAIGQNTCDCRQRDERDGGDSGNKPADSLEVIGDIAA